MVAKKQDTEYKFSNTTAGKVFLIIRAKIKMKARDIARHTVPPQTECEMNTFAAPMP
jgi:hypothetical protein